MAKPKVRKSPDIGATSPITLGEFSQQAMRTYGSFVLMDRAVADVRDGLKPVQRRILWAMHELKLSGKGFKKSAKIVGDTMGNYHPHGDSSIYETLVNLVGDRYPLIEGHGNFGSATDNAASMRYTEARLTPLAEELFRDIDVGAFVPNYSGDKQEPLVLPSRLPLLLLNGSSGIGVALRTIIPPHNLRELVKVLIYFIMRPAPSMDAIMKHLHGPDYGHGVLLSDAAEIQALYETGKGSLKFRCEYEFETNKKQGSTLVLKSLAPGFRLGPFLTKMRGLADAGLIEFCSDATSAKGICVYVGFKDATVLKDRVIPELHTTQSYQFYVVKRDDDSSMGEDTLFSGGLFRLFQEFADFRRTVEKARLERELKLAKLQLLRAKAILAAIENLAAVYAVLQESHPTLEAIRLRMAEALSISENQAQVVLDMKVHQLACMNQESQLSKIEEIRASIVTIRTDLNDIDGVIVRHLKTLAVFSDERGTKLAASVPSPLLHVEDSEKYVVSQGTKLLRMDKEPSRRHKFDFVARAVSTVTAILSNNEALSLSLSYLTEETVSHALVGLIPDSAILICAVDSHGKIVTLTPPTKTSYNVMRGATELVSAAGAVPGGRVAFIANTGRGRVLASESMDGSRAFVRGRKIYPTDDHGTSKDHLVRVVSLPPGAELFDSKGRCLTSDGEYFEGKGSIFAIGESNFVLVKSEDRRDIVNYDDAISLLRGGDMKECWIL